MAIYFVEIVMLIVMSPLCKKKLILRKKKYEGRNIYLLLAFLMLGTVMALRAWSIGSDTGMYYRMFERISYAGSYREAVKTSQISAPVYVAYAYILGKVIKIPQAITLCNAIVVSFGMYSFIKRASSNYFISTILYLALPLYYESMNGTRQFMSLVFVLNAYLYLLESRRSIKGWILFAIGVGLHTVALFFGLAIVSVYLVNRIKDEKKLFFWSVLISIILTLAFQFVSSVINRFLPSYSMYINGRNTAQLLAQSGGGRIVLLYILLALIIILIVLKMKNYDSYIINDVSLKNMIPPLVFCVVFGIYYSHNNLVNRLLWYFITLFIIFIPNGYKLYKTNEKLVLTVGTVAAIMIYGVVHLIEDKSGIVPYIPFWGI